MQPVVTVEPVVTEPAVVEAPPTTEAPVETPAQENARKSAESYLDSQPFSRSGLIGQLEYEGFTTAQATYGVNAAGL